MSRSSDIVHYVTISGSDIVAMLAIFARVPSAWCEVCEEKSAWKRSHVQTKIMEDR